MRLKSFHGPTITDAMRQVREAFGDDAIIVATRDDEGGGVRVTAAIDDSPPPSLVPPEQDGDIIEQVSDMLFRQGVHAGLAEKLLATATNFAEDDPVIALAAAFDAHMKFHTAAPGRPLIFCGPPGGGKTLAIAKLATAARLKRQPVTIITTDLVRAGGVEQMAAFTKVLQVKLLEIEEPQAAADTVAELAGNQLVLVDSAGCNPYDPVARRELQHILKAIDGDRLMALPCGRDTEDGIALTQAFSDMGATHLLLTGADLVQRLGSTLNIAGAGTMALTYVSRSPRAAEPLIPLNPITLARLLLDPQQTQSASATSQTGTHA